MNYPAPHDPSPRTRTVRLPVVGGAAIAAVDDPYSDRLRCDHPEEDTDGAALAEALRAEAARAGRGRLVVLAPPPVAQGLTAAGFALEATMPGFYAGAEDCAVLGMAIDAGRAALANPVEVAGVDSLLAQGHPGRSHPPVTSTRATGADAEDIAELIGETFAQYPTPSAAPSYIEEAIDAGVPFRLVRDAGVVVACASADLVAEARTAELTDCATRPSHRGRGLMQGILGDLMDDLRAMKYPTAFTLARARIPGVNLAFQRLGFELRGRMVRSCRIGDGLEDMNVWSRALA